MNADAALIKLFPEIIPVGEMAGITHHLRDGKNFFACSNLFEAFLIALEKHQERESLLKDGMIRWIQQFTSWRFKIRLLCSKSKVITGNFLDLIDAQFQLIPLFYAAGYNTYCRQLLHLKFVERPKIEKLLKDGFEIPLFAGIETGVAADRHNEMQVRSLKTVMNTFSLRFWVGIVMLFLTKKWRFVLDFYSIKSIDRPQPCLQISTRFKLKRQTYKQISAEF